MSVRMFVKSIQKSFCSAHPHSHPHKNYKSPFTRPVQAMCSEENNNRRVSLLYDNLQYHGCHDDVTPSLATYKAALLFHFRANVNDFKVRS